MITSQEPSIMVEGGAEDFEGGEEKKKATGFTDKTETT
jgi:hypothetical protein